MPLPFVIALAAATATPATRPKAAAPRPPVAGKAESKKPPVDPMAAMTMMLQVFDKLFPPGPEPEPARLAAARGTVATMFPKGAYAAAMTGFMNRTMDRVLDMSEADFVGMFPDSRKDKKAKPPSTEKLRSKLMREEPNFDAKLAAIRAFAGTMLTKVGDVAEPKFRDGMARALARKFDPVQLGQINAFLATPTGAAYGQEMVGLWFEPDVMRGAFQLFPEMVRMMPQLAGDAAALEAQIKDKPKGDKK